jgi:porin
VVPVAGDDGRVAALEIGAARPGQEPKSFKLVAGFWHLDRVFQDPLAGERRSNRGGYLIGERTLAGGREERAWGVFSQAGHSRPDRNQVEGYLGAGVVFHGWWPGRPQDSFAIGVAQARLARSFRAAQAGRHASETTWEATYRITLRPGLVLQPDLQFVHHPDAVLGAENALVATLRVVASF